MATGAKRDFRELLVWQKAMSLVTSKQLGTDNPAKPQKALAVPMAR
jgi:hypothetical protein